MIVALVANKADLSSDRTVENEVLVVGFPINSFTSFQVDMDSIQKSYYDCYSYYYYFLSFFGQNILLKLHDDCWYSYLDICCPSIKHAFLSDTFSSLFFTHPQSPFLDFKLNESSPIR